MITLQTEGRRLYVCGDAYPIKSAIKSAGGHWDAEKKAWWIGVAKRGEIEAALSKAFAQPPAPKPDEVYDGPVRGKAEYNGRSYYVIFHGPTVNSDEAFRLVTLDGKITFWKDATAGVKMVKQYEKKPDWTRYGRTIHGTGGYPTLAGIRSFVQERKDVASGKITEETKVCWECGRVFARHECRGGDWQDSYCGC